MFSGLNSSTFGVNISDLIQATNNLSAVIPLYLTKPNAPKGIAPNIHIQDVASNPTLFLNMKYNNTATIQAKAEKMNCLKDSPKKILSV